MSASKLGEQQIIASSLGLNSGRAEFSGNIATGKQRIFTASELMMLPGDEQIIHIADIGFIHCKKILDDWGPDRLSAGQRRDLMEIVEDRYGAASTLITSQLPVDKWHDVIGEPTFADAILDRLVHNSYRLELDGPSMRKTRSGKGEKTA